MTVNRSKTSPGLIGRLTVLATAFSIRSCFFHMVIAGALTSAILPIDSAKSGTLLPPGEQQFFGADGTTPNAAGCVYFYVPGTTNPKATYQNAAQTIANTNPVQLDAAGRAIIYGTGTYRQVVTATGPNGSTPCLPSGAQIWDQLTADTSSSITIYAGASAGTPNAITVTAPAFSGTDGQVINYVSTNTNTAAATINPSGFGAVAIVRDSATGPGALTGGELVATNTVSLIYDATAGTFHILSPVTWPNTSGVPVGAVIPVAGFAAPTNYALTYGQAVSRATFSGLLSALTSAQSGTISSGSPTITGLSDITQLGAGQPVEAVGIPASTTLLSCTGTSCTMSANATASRTGTMTFFAFPDGDGSTTFNLPDYRGIVLAGRDNMGGTSASRLTSATITPNGTTLGASGGTQTQTLTLSQIPTGITASGTFPVALGNIVSANSPVNLFSTAGGGTVFEAFSNGAIVTVNTSTTASGTVTSTNTGGTSHPIVQPTSIINWAIRLVP